MHSLKHISLVIGLALFVLFVPYALFSADPTCTQIGGVCVLEPSLFDAAGTGPVFNLSDYLRAVFRIGVGVAAALAVVQIVIGGFKYMTQDIPGVKQDAREQITEAVLGLILVGASYLILQQINPNILNFDLVQTLQEAVERAEGIGAAGEVPAGQEVPENIIRSMLNQAGIYVNNPPCPFGQTQGCTNLVGLPTSAIRDLITLKQTCGCAVMITGGTEGGHIEHEPGNPVVDLRPNGELNSFLWGNSGNPANGYRVNNSLGSFTFETEGGASSGDHWHVNFGG